MTRDLPRLILDANIMISALMGRSFPLILELFEAGIRLLAPVHQLAETRHRLQELTDLPQAWVDMQMQQLIAVIEPLHPALLDKHEADARLRLNERGQPDWPVLAACLETKAAIWSHDKDFFGSGAPVWSTSMLRRQMAGVA